MFGVAENLLYRSSLLSAFDASSTRKANHESLKDPERAGFFPENRVRRLGLVACFGFGFAMCPKQMSADRKQGAIATASTGKARFARAWFRGDRAAQASHQARQRGQEQTLRGWKGRPNGKGLQVLCALEFNSRAAGVCLFRLLCLPR